MEATDKVRKRWKEFGGSFKLSGKSLSRNPQICFQNIPNKIWKEKRILENYLQIAWVFFSTQVIVGWVQNYWRIHLETSTVSSFVLSYKTIRYECRKKTTRACYTSSTNVINSVNINFDLHHFFWLVSWAELDTNEFVAPTRMSCLLSYVYLMEVTCRTYLQVSCYLNYAGKKMLKESNVIVLTWHQRVLMSFFK